MTSQFDLFLIRQGLAPFSEPNSANGGLAHKQTAENGCSAPVGTGGAIKETVLSPTTIGARVRPTNRKIGRFTVSGAVCTGSLVSIAGCKKAEIGASVSSKVEGNRRGRRSTALRLSEVRNIRAAAVFTAQKHRPLNRHTTIHFEAAGIDQPVRAIGQYLKLAGDWLRTQGVTFAYIWVREAGDGKGEHAHVLMHVPHELISGFARRERGWRKRIGAKRALGAFRSTPVGRSYRHAQSGIQYGESYSNHLEEIVGYVVKGAEPRAVKLLNLPRQEPGGELWGKRCGMSENIGRAARSRAQ